MNTLCTYHNSPEHLYPCNKMAVYDLIQPQPNNKDLYWPVCKEHFMQAMASFPMSWRQHQEAPFGVALG